MSDLPMADTHTSQITIPQLAVLFDCSDTMVRQVMRRIEIPKRGGGYSRQRLWAALGFTGTFPPDDDPLWQPLLDVAAAAKIVGVSEKTIGRLFDGTHADKTLGNYLWLGPRKRQIIRFELKAWQAGITPLHDRPVERIHPGLRPGARNADRSPQKSDLFGRHTPPSAGLFLPPRRV